MTQACAYISYICHHWYRHWWLQ